MPHVSASVKRAFLTGSAILILSLILVISVGYGQGAGSLQVSYIDVGQGDSIWLHASDGTDVLIDGGPPSAGPTVVAYLQQRGLDGIEAMVVSHADADHSGGLVDVLRSPITVTAVIYNGLLVSTTTYLNLLAEMQTRGLTPTPASAGQSYKWGPINSSVLNPQATPSGNQNDDSVVLLVNYGNRRFLFSGDISNSAEQSILAMGTPIAADVLKVPHHGSKYGSSSPFLVAVSPQLAIISVGAGNQYGHPDQETVDRLAAVSAQVLRTDEKGTIVVTTDGQTLDVTWNHLLFLPAVRK
ncbi:MAG: ComEC/Rec2 family competence protein [Dehalococcoidales bacterium]|nr:ComEC/Rec2 family competence protein [Dehalococcoidales bacterium]